MRLLHSLVGAFLGSYTIKVFVAIRWFATSLKVIGRKIKNIQIISLHDLCFIFTECNYSLLIFFFSKERYFWKQGGCDQNHISVMCFFLHMTGVKINEIFINISSSSLCVCSWNPWWFSFLSHLKQPQTNGLVSAARYLTHLHVQIGYYHGSPKSKNK